MLFTLLKTCLKYDKLTSSVAKLMQLKPFNSDDKKKENIFYFQPKNGKEIIVLPIKNDQNSIILLGTFEKTKVQEFIISFKRAENLGVSEVRFKSESFKKLVFSNYSVVEISAAIHYPTFQEISISGSDIKSSDFYNMILREGEIKKIVLYLNIDDFTCVAKLFVEGKVSIIPELEFKQVNLLFSNLLQRLEIE